MLSPNNTDTPSPNADNSNRSSGQSNSNSRGNNRNRNINIQSSESVTFEGACPDIGAVAALCTEKINKKVPFAVFAEKVADYVITNYKYRSDVENTIRELTDPFSDFSLLHKPAPLTVAEPSFDEKHL